MNCVKLRAGLGKKGKDETFAAGREGEIFRLPAQDPHFHVKYQLSLAFRSKLRAKAC